MKSQWESQAKIITFWNDSFLVSNVLSTLNTDSIWFNMNCFICQVYFALALVWFCSALSFKRDRVSCGLLWPWNNHPASNSHVMDMCHQDLLIVVTVIDRWRLFNLKSNGVDAQIWLSCVVMIWRGGEEHLLKSIIPTAKFV